MALVVLMSREGFYIVRCPRCGRYTYAPTRQKTRLCVYCQRIFKINPLNAVFVDDAVTARTRVKLYQTGKHHKDFMEAVEKSREKVQTLIPDDNLSIDALKESKHDIQPVSARRRELERILYQHARKKALDLQVLENECQKSGVPWGWVIQQIETLIRTGHLILPKPWQIRLITDKISSTEKETRRISPTKLAQRVGSILRGSQTSLSYDEIVARLEEEAISTTGLDEALSLLRNQGYILKSAKGTFQWTGD